MKIIPLLTTLLVTTAPALFAAEGYKDTPIIPGTPFHIHDPDRPLPKIVVPGEFSIQEKAGSAPADATVLFDGKDLSAWRTGDGPAKWKVENGYFEVIPGTGTLHTKAEFGPDVQMHIEWQMLPSENHGQARSNSGVFFYGRYEIQVLDCYDNPTYADGHAGALYSQTPPMVNVTRKPGEWNVYDIVFNAPRFDKDGKLVTPAYATVLHNGVLVQNHTELIGDTMFRTASKYVAHPEKGDISLQDHSTPVRFRNVWIREFKKVEPVAVRADQVPAPAEKK